MNSIDMDISYIAALDIGGTKIVATLADASGPLARLAQPTVRTGMDRALAEQAVAMIESICASADVPLARIAAVGVSSCGPFTQRDGMLALVSPNLCGALPGATDLPNDWESIPLEKVLRERFANVVIRNDGVAALIAERAFGTLQGENDCAYVTWSTGIGFGLCVDGHVLHGKQGNAGHAGHMLMSDQSDALCGCGNFGDVEALTSGRNLGRRLDRNMADLFAAARAGSREELAIVEQAAGWLGRALYNVSVTLDTCKFAMGGSVWLHHGDWLEPLLMKEITGRLPAVTAGVSIMPAALGSLVADMGAFCLVMPDDWAVQWRTTRPWLKVG